LIFYEDNDISKKKQGRLIYVPAGAVRHRPQVYLGITRFKEC